MIQRAKTLLALGGAAALLGTMVMPEPRVAALAIPDDPQLCQTTSAPVRAEGSGLSTLTSAGLEGMTYDTASGSLQLEKESGSLVLAKNMDLGDVFMACAADFDEDGWTDFIASDYAGSGHTAGVGFLKLYRNTSGASATPDWSDVNATRDPGFTPSVIEASSSNKGSGTLVCGDIDKDGHQDVLILRCAYGQSCASPSRAQILLGNGNGTFDPAYDFLSFPASGVGGYIYYDGDRAVLYDVDKDNDLDLVVGTTDLASGRITWLANDGATSPHFSSPATLYAPAGLTFFGVTALAIADFTNDGKDDLVFGSADSLIVTLVPGTDSGFDGLPQIITPPTGYVVGLKVADIASNGRADLVVVTDALKAYVYENDGDSFPFSGAVSTTIDPGGSASDTFDAAVVMDYDHDPNGSPDLIVNNADSTSQGFVYANRPGSTFVACGTATSGQIPTPELASTSGTVTEVRLSPEPASPTDGTWTFWASNDDGVTWAIATPCIDDATDYCADVSATTGSIVRWRVEMCSNTGGASPNTAAPTMTAVETTYTYILASTHFRAGPVVRDDIIYVGATKEPGHEGQFLAINNETGTVLWDAGAKLDATVAANRHIYGHRSTGLRVDLQSFSLLDLLALDDIFNLLSSLLGGDLRTWLVSKRFGVDPDAPRTMGGVVNSTAAVLSRPGRPYYFGLATTPDSEKELINTHVETFKDRQNLVFVGSQTGMLHAFYTNPLQPTDSKNGFEAWAWVPRNISRRLNGDKTSGEVTAFVDGSPTLVVAKIGTSYRDILVMGEGTGGDEVYALDVTETIDSGGTVLGPTFLWRFNDSNMGQTVSKPTVIRTLVSGVETWMAVFASGPDPSGDKGDTLYAVNLETGSLIWKFDIGDTNTYISTDITAVDEEVGDPDGFISRLYFADNKGRLWKLDPAVFSGGVASPVGSTIDVGLSGKPALFSTRLTSSALGEDRAINANIIAVPDAAKRVILYFGTGGTAETAPGEVNAFYAAYGDTGEIKNQVQITGARFNGASYQDGQLVFTNSEIPDTAGPCVISQSRAVAIDADTFALQDEAVFDGAIVGPVFAARGELFAVTVTGKLIASQYTGNNRATTAAEDAAAASGEGAGTLNPVSPAFSVLGWKQTY